MYKVIKGRNWSNTPILINTETKSRTSIGASILKVKEVLEEHSFSVPKIADDWNIDIDKETAQALIDLVFTIKAPTNRIKTTKQKTIDAKDVLLGLAHY